MKNNKIIISEISQPQAQCLSFCITLHLIHIYNYVILADVLIQRLSKKKLLSEGSQNDSAV